ncbi:MAG: NADH:ubiquinone reductase (Na(+)-transporting) subunit C [Bacteroidales bacterium]|jgi:Na+-transporting NADH:ubiquinone oxidoreductase subunit C|nr:NADH:ubiquinone reductase (Na(+)-transporting) subunit C [Bacteroidales bacterium]
MNTNSNTYTIIYTTLIVVLVAAVLAFVSQSLKSRQEANEKADTMSQILTAAGFATKAELQAAGNTAVLERFAQELDRSFTVGTDGQKVADLEADKVYSPKELKQQNYNIKDGSAAQLPVFIFKNGITVVPVYGAGLWGPVWGYIAFEPGSNVMKGAYFDHESETAGLGAKIKDDPSFQAEFSGESADFNSANVFDIVKGGAPKNPDGTSVADNQIDAITGATMTSNGLDAAIDTWLGAYSAYFKGAVTAKDDCCGDGSCEEGMSCCEGESAGEGMSCCEETKTEEE